MLIYGLFFLCPCQSFASPSTSNSVFSLGCSAIEACRNPLTLPRCQSYSLHQIFLPLNKDEIIYNWNNRIIAFNIAAIGGRTVKVDERGFFAFPFSLVSSSVLSKDDSSSVSSKSSSSSLLGMILKELLSLNALLSEMLPLAFKFGF